MSLTKQELLEEINVEKEKIRFYDKEYFNNKPILRAQKAIQLLDNGHSVEHHHSGLLVDSKYIVAVSKNKWRVLGTSRWFKYKSIYEFSNAVDFMRSYYV